MAAEYEAELPENFQQYIDFTTNLFFLVVGFVLRRMGFIKEEHLSGMQVLVFTLCLPFLMAGVLWTAAIEQEVMKVLLASAITNTVGVSIGLMAAQRLPPKMRGQYLMACTGSAMAYVYPVVLKAERLSAVGVPIVVMWELGGNIVVAVVFHGLVAQAYSPKRWEGHPLQGATPEATPTSAQALDKFPEIPPQTIGTATSSTSPDELVFSELTNRTSDINPSVAGLRARAGSGSEENGTSAAPRTIGSQVVSALRRSVGVIIRTPLIWGIIVGLTLNISGTPFTALPGRAVNALTGSFAPLLYVLLGASLRFNLGLAMYGTVAKTLALRWTLGAILVLFTRFVLPLFIPLSNIMLGVISLCIFAPITTTCVMFSGQHGYKMDLVAMTKNISDVVSLILLTVLSLLI
mmetsp:Transcript_48323/g.104049  ORF Transcript_48323/g.104049 Transcript_48323/m.104049 type:complete len:406 (-) Transcript_48323:507-1724(-)|eukprot:CAMPEP_0206599816 /NCGR_PEP_ID=MMETSP0325_2-20121206/45396_1 /ASSEMBLY_ACC=CAM_ASM_000347 /TAXON_ID=2866 /ORGANISM="Crypthecodinium cohnii, Strain Seligo" /LENGTH=405 /DNA_ID=CAMNT_0054110943 /DNA_START=153 /DNA_END=1370 /DNA_ORIENTATION=+